jgi:hypothetical protein
MFEEIKASLQQLYLEDQRPWLVGFSGDVGPNSVQPSVGPNSVRPGPKALRPYNSAVLAIPAEQRKKPMSDSVAQGGVPVPPQRSPPFSDQSSVNIDVNPVPPTLKPALRSTSIDS